MLSDRSICLAAALLISLAAVPALADIYKTVDAEGRVTYSNIPMKGAKKLDLGPAPLTFPGPKHHGKGSGSSSPATSSYTPPSPSNFPRVDASTQHSRDMDRRSILSEEMGHEQSLLADARKQLATSPQDAKARDNVTFHEKNIEALQTEMARIK
jgi:hypothetical protein